MSTIAVVQARMTSARLPGKVLTTSAAARAPQLNRVGGLIAC
ncbi:MAG: hypothetical protein ACLP0J_26920 [Solirubrobacteraceae bacterium]